MCVYVLFVRLHRINVKEMLKFSKSVIITIYAQDIIKCYHLNCICSYLHISPFTMLRSNCSYNYYTILCACLVYIILIKSTA